MSTKSTYICQKLITAHFGLVKGLKWEKFFHDQSQVSYVASWESNSEFLDLQSDWLNNVICTPPPDQVYCPCDGICFL